MTEILTCKTRTLWCKMKTMYSCSTFHLVIYSTNLVNSSYHLLHHKSIYLCHFQILNLEVNHTWVSFTCTDRTVQAPSDQKEKTWVVQKPFLKPTSPPPRHCRPYSCLGCLFNLGSMQGPYYSWQWFIIIPLFCTFKCHW